MSDTNARFEEWFSTKFGSIGDADITATFRKVAKAAFDEGVRTGTRPSLGHRPDFTNTSQFADNDTYGRPDVPSSAPRRPTSQFDDVMGYDRPDAPRTAQRSRHASQFDDVVGDDRPDTPSRPSSSSQFSDTTYFQR